MKPVSLDCANAYEIRGNSLNSAEFLMFLKNSLYQAKAISLAFM